MSPTEILRRLERLDPAAPAFDRAAVEAALDAHFSALGLERPPLRWMPGLGAAFDAAEKRSWHREWLVAEADAWYAARVALGCERDPAWEDGTTAVERPLALDARKAAWRREDQTLLTVDRMPLLEPEDPNSAVRIFRTATRFPSMQGRDGRLLAASWKPGTRAATLAGRLRGDGGAENRATRFEPWRPARFEHLTGAAAAEEAVAWIAAASRLDSVPRPLSRMIDLWSPLLGAFEAGLWAYFIFADEMLLVPRAAVRLHRNRLHSDRGPAISWPDGESLWFWNGVEVPRRLVEEPQRITTQDVLQESNIEIRRVLLERYGAQRFLIDVGARPVHSDDFGTLYKVEFENDEPLVMVKVLNSTPEPDGARKEYFLRVPPTMVTAREAVAWTFGLLPEDYRPRQET